MLSVCRWVGRVLQVGCTALLALLLACNLYLIAMEHIFGVESPTIFGYSSAIVVSGSMEPALSVDDWIVNHAQESYLEGDIITFHSGESLTTHRIVAVDAAGFVTQGDANNAADVGTVAPEQVVGKVVWRIPSVGGVIEYFKTPFGMMAFLFAGVLLIELSFLLQRRNEMDGDER